MDSINPQTIEQLRENEELFNALVENMLDAVVIIDWDGTVQFANNAAARMLGLKCREEAVGRNQVEFLHPDCVERAAKEMMMVAEGKGEFLSEYQLLIDGNVIDVESHGVVVQYKGNSADMVTFRDVTERKQAEGERKFRVLVESTSATIGITYEEEGKIHVLLANSAFETAFTDKLKRKEAEALLGDGASLDKNTWEDVAGYREMNAAIAEAENEGRNQFIYEFQEHNGRWNKVHGTRTHMDGKDCTIWTSFDISDQKRIQLALTESEKKFRALAESTSAQIAITQQVGDESRFVYANQAILEYQGLTWEQLTRVNPADTLPKSATKTGERAWQQAADEGSNSYSFEYEATPGVWILVHAVQMELEGKDSTIWTSFDISDQKRIQRELATSEDRYRAIFETTGTGTIIFGDDTVISLANDEWATLVGYNREEMEGKMSWTAFFTEESLNKMREYHKMRSKAPASVPYAYEADVQPREGKVLNGIVTISMIPETEQSVASFQDLTELKRVQKQMYQADKMAALGQIIAGVAHEINNPNNFIYFNLPILRRYLDGMRPILDAQLADEKDAAILEVPYEIFLEDIYKLLENMEHGSSRITSIVSDLKNYVRSDDSDEIREEVMAPIVEQVMALVGKQVRKMVKRFDVSIEENLPLVPMNAGKIEQVLINLLVNAGQAVDNDDSFVTLTVRTAPDHHVELVVEDNGAGIPKAIADQVFEPFFTSKNRETGTGLGLSISHKIIEDHGGTIAMSSVEGEGTTFTVRLPLS